MRSFPPLLLATLLCAGHRAAPAAEPDFAQRYSIPAWASTQLEAAPFAQRYVADARLNPYCLHGDFDGDGRRDFALFVRDRAGQRIGIAFLHQGGGMPHVVGAGHELGNGGDDFAWVDAWSLVERGPLPEGIDGAAPTLLGDAVTIHRTESASALLWWDGAAYRWYQQGD
jgi:hypothetical protein